MGKSAKKHKVSPPAGGVGKRKLPDRKAKTDALPKIQKQAATGGSGGGFGGATGRASAPVAGAPTEAYALGPGLVPKHFKRGLLRVHNKGAFGKDGLTTGIPVIGGELPGRKGRKFSKANKAARSRFAKEMQAKPGVVPRKAVVDGKPYDIWSELSHQRRNAEFGSGRTSNAFPATPHENTEHLTLEEAVSKQSAKAPTRDYRVKHTAYVARKGRTKYLRTKAYVDGKKVVDQLRDAGRPDIDKDEVKKRKAEFVTALGAKKPKLVGKFSDPKKPARGISTTAPPSKKAMQAGKGMFTDIKDGKKRRFSDDPDGADAFLEGLPFYQ